MRLTCCVPMCRRTRASNDVAVCEDGRVVEYGEWICQKHWSRVPMAMRREHAQGKRMVRRLRTPESLVASDAIWVRCKEKATDIAFGLG